MESPAVTVGLPVHNAADELRSSVPTVFGQTWTGGRVRLLVVDDGSTDETPEVLAELTRRYEGIEVIRHERSRGRPAALNTILEHAGDDYLAWIDVGDLWHPRKLEVQLAALAEAESVGDEPVICVGPFKWISTDRRDARVRVPDVEGDQLPAALTGRIFPHLQAIVGRAEHFRAVGGFDQRLARRQDYDMLVRFVGAGGRVVSSRLDVPVFTYLKSHVGASASSVASANRTLRLKHREYYDRYGRRLAHDVRNSLHRLAARSYRSDGSRMRAAAYEALGVLASPASAARRFGRRVWRPSRLARKTARLPLRLVRPLLPVLQRTEAIELARKAGAFKLMALTGLDRRIMANLRAEVEDTSGSSPTPILPGGSVPADAEQLEAEIADATPVPAEKWLSLEYAYRKHGLLCSAESALRRVMEQHPRDPALTVRLVELLSLRRQWTACVETWEAHDDVNSLPVRGLTFARVARSYRELGRFEKALSAAIEGARRWPNDFRITDELYLCRAVVVDWKRALRAVVADGDVGGRAVGRVTDPGFLTGNDGPLTGQVAAHRPSPVALVVNGGTVATTQATHVEGDSAWLRFSLSAHDLCSYLGDGDIITIESDGARLAVDGKATSWQVTTGYHSRMSELRRELTSGHVFTKRGQLRMGYTPERREHALALFDEVSALIEKSHGYASYPFYGQLLGAIREHDFIAHDAGGFDMGYVSRNTTPDSVRTEFMDILRMLLGRGYHLRLEPWSAYVRPVRTSRVFVDLNYGWFNPAGELNLSFGWRHEPVKDRLEFEQPRQSVIGNHPIRVPGNAEAVLDQIYGPTWAVPDQGFVLATDIRRDERFILSIDEMKDLEQYDPDRVVAIFDHHPHGATDS